MAEAENKASQLFEEKEAKQKQMKAAIIKSRKNQIERKHREIDAKKREEVEFSEFWKMRNEELAIAE